MAEFETRYTTAFDYVKHVDATGAVTVINRLNQKNNQAFPLMHAADISIGDDEAATNRLNIKLQSIDQIFRDIYGDTPSTLEAYTDGRTEAELTALAADGGIYGAIGGTGIHSFARVAAIFNNRTETIDDRIKDLKLIKTITIGASGTNTGNTAVDASTTDIVADNSSDTVTISALDKWIVLNANASTDSFTIGHYKLAFTPTTATYDFNTLVTNGTTPKQNTFAIPVLTYDEAGHITAKETTTYTLPDNYKTFKITNSTAVTAITTSNSPVDVVAGNILGEMTFAAGNKWIQLASDNTTKTITLGHATSILTAGVHATTFESEYQTTVIDQGVETTTNTTQTPSFGSNFKILIPKISFTTDEAGHVTAYSNSYIEPEITIPQGSIGDTDKGTKNVMTGLSLTQSTMAFSREWSYLADLLLTNYSYTSGYAVRPTVNGTPAAQTYTLAATDSLKEALSKLQGYAVSNHNAIDQEVADRTQAITDLINGASADYDTLSEIETAVKAAQGAADDAQGDIDDHEGDTNNPHSVTASQVGLGNLTNNKQVKATSSQVISGHIVTWSGTTGDAVSDSGYTIETSVPPNAVFTDTTYETGTDTTEGLTKLYTDVDASQTDGAITSAAMVTILEDAIAAAVNTVLSNFSGLTLDMPTSVTWAVDGNTLTYTLDKDLEGVTIQIEKLEEGDWNTVSAPVPADPGEYRLKASRSFEVGETTYTQALTQIGNTYTINEP